MGGSYQDRSKEKGTPMSFNSKDFNDACKLATKYKLDRKDVSIVSDKVRAWLDNIDKQIAEDKKTLQKYLDFIDTLPIRPHEPAFHRKLGPVLVKAIGFGNEKTERYGPQSYTIVDKNGKIHESVPAIEIKPYGKSSKVLYGEANDD